MSYSDFFKALTPYNYTSVKDMDDYFKENTISALKLADVNGDGVIDFTEFFFFITIMQIPENIVREVFEKNGDNKETLCKDDFTKVLTILRKRTIMGSK
jgi:Ca2+-binding EF-hand superfamily protein